MKKCVIMADEGLVSEGRHTHTRTPAPFPTPHTNAPASGSVYTWGESSYGQLGLGPEVVPRNSCPFPQRVMLPASTTVRLEHARRQPPLVHASIRSYACPHHATCTCSFKHIYLYMRTYIHDTTYIHTSIHASTSIHTQEDGGHQAEGEPLVAAHVSCGGMHTGTLRVCV